MQTYDHEGTTRFQYTYIDQGVGEWCVLFAQGHIKISDVFGTTNLRLNFPETDHWTYERREASVDEDGTVDHGAQIKTNDFTLIVDVCEYLESDDDEPNPNMGFIMLETAVTKLRLSIPYGLAKSLITVMSGSTDPAGVVGIMKS